MTRPVNSGHREVAEGLGIRQQKIDGRRSPSRNIEDRRPWLCRNDQKHIVAQVRPGLLRPSASTVRPANAILA